MKRALFWTLLAAALLAPYVIYPLFLMKVLCFALFACAFNLLIGFGGLLSFGHAAFFGSAAYVTAYAAKELSLGPELSILAGVAVATVMGAAFGWLAIRRTGIYFAMITLALSQLVYFYALQAPWTRGEDGVQSVPRGHLFGFIDLDQPLAMYYLVLALFLFGFAVIHRTVHSPYGQVLAAIRENEPRAISLGYKASRYKLLAFVLSSAFAGLAGSMKALVFQIASLNDVHWSMSGDVVLMTLIGGMGTLMGPVVGAVIVSSMNVYLAALGTWVTVVQGTIFVLFVLLLRRGVVGELRDLLRRWRNRRTPLRDDAAVKTGKAQ